MQVRASLRGQGHRRPSRCPRRPRGTLTWTAPSAITGRPPHPQPALCSPAQLTLLRVISFRHPCLRRLTGDTPALRSQQGHHNPHHLLCPSSRTFLLLHLLWGPGLPKPLASDRTLLPHKWSEGLVTPCTAGWPTAPPPGQELATHHLPADPPSPSTQLLPAGPCPGDRRPCQLGAAFTCRPSRAACSSSLRSCRSCGQRQTLPPATAAIRPRSGAWCWHPGNSSGPSRAGPDFQDGAPTLYLGTELLREQQGAGVISQPLMPGTTFQHWIPRRDPGGERCSESEKWRKYRDLLTPETTRDWGSMLVRGRGDSGDMRLKRKGLCDLPGGPAVRTECFPCRGRGFAPWLGS